MNETCVHHRRPAAAKVGVEWYCETCLRGIAAARKRVPLHYPNREWHVGYFGAPRRRWQPLHVPPEANWVAREIGLRMAARPETTLDGYPIHQAIIVGRCRPVASVAEIREKDVYFLKPFGPIGVVRAVQRSIGGRPPKIAIAMFLSERKEIVTRDFVFDLRQKGAFLRLGR